MYRRSVVLTKLFYNTSMRVIEFWYLCIHYLLIAAIKPLCTPSNITLITPSGHHVIPSLTRCLACVWRTSLILLHTGALWASVCGEISACLCYHYRRHHYYHHRIHVKMISILFINKGTKSRTSPKSLKVCQLVCPLHFLFVGC